MIIAEILKTCSHSDVAEAAVASIGRDFRQRVDSLAVARGVRAGDFAAQIVRDFGLNQDSVKIIAFEAAVRKTDMPVLGGLRLILEDAMAPTDGGKRPPPSYA